MKDIERKINDTTKEVFSFWFDSSRNKLFLDTYHIMEFVSKRKGFKVVKGYSRLDHRTIKQYNSIELKDVPFTEEIKKIAKDQLMSEIKVCLWGE